MNAKRRFFVPPGKMIDGRAELQAADARHLRTVMRLRSGDRVVVFDGTGKTYQAVVRSMEDDRVIVDLLSQADSTTESHLDLALAQGFLKEKKMDELIRPLSELGVTRWIPFKAHRSVPAPDPQRMAARLARWRKISIEALKQCRRNRPMVIEAPVSFDAVLRLAEPYPLKLLFWEDEPAPPDRTAGDPQPDGVFILIGPEGGFEAGEAEQARAAGFKPAGLGPRILRAETATLSAAALVQYLWGDMGPQQDAGRAEEELRRPPAM